MSTDDTSAGAPEIDITEKMIRAGVSVVAPFFDEVFDQGFDYEPEIARQVVIEVYLAMSFPTAWMKLTRRLLTPDKPYKLPGKKQRKQRTKKRLGST